VRLPGDPIPRAQHGFAVPVEHAERIDTTAGWEALRVAHDEAFATLERLAGGVATEA
jgi:hypothetical protein